MKKKITPSRIAMCKDPEFVEIFGEDPHQLTTDFLTPTKLAMMAMRHPRAFTAPHEAARDAYGLWEACYSELDVLWNDQLHYDMRTLRIEYRCLELLVPWPKSGMEPETRRLDHLPNTKKRFIDKYGDGYSREIPRDVDPIFFESYLEMVMTKADGTTIPKTKREELWQDFTWYLANRAALLMQHKPEISELFSGKQSDVIFTIEPAQHHEQEAIYDGFKKGVKLHEAAYYADIFHMWRCASTSAAASNKASNAAKVKHGKPAQKKMPRAKNNS